MRLPLPFLGAISVLGLAAPLPADDPKPAPKPTLVIERRGPPNLLPNGKGFTITYTITVEGLVEPRRHPSSCGGYDPTLIEGALLSWRLNGFEVEKAGETRVRFLGWKDKATGKVFPVTGIKIESEDLPPNQLPTVVPDPKA